ncbi:MAG TPA: DnaJ C-terminal domain-containing protein, partial [Mycobacteriales bacterium]|nr:DnaJ C-terminal domain-containing protein [Mycobacteriales bacterium]
MSTKDYLEKDYYAALGVAKDASSADIKKAYRALARKLHPDANPGDAKAEARFKEVSEAYDVLSNPTRRKEYDEARSLFGSGLGGLGGGNFPSGGGTTFDFGDIFSQAGARAGSGGLGDMLGGLFGGGRANTRRGTRTSRRGADVETELTLDFEEAVRGMTVPLKLSSPHACTTCHGSGARPGTTPRPCPSCAGSGFVTRNQGAFAFSEPCRECRGRGQIVDDPCPDCAGSGVQTGVREITVRIPPGVKDGQKIRIPGRGAPGEQGGPAGDLMVLVHVRPHALFGRKGDNLTLTLPVSFPEAALGATVRVP